MITIHEAKAADFSTLGLGALLPSECTVRERAGGMYELKIVHPVTDDGRHHRIKPMRIIKAPAPMRETPLVELNQIGTVYRDIYKVVTDGRRLYLRVKPDQESKGLHAYKPGTEVVSLELSDDGKWRRVAILDGGATGWMWAGNLEFVRTETETIVGDTPGGIVQPRQTREQLFRVYRYSPGSKERAVTAEARHITYDLAGAVVEGEYSPENVAADQVCAQIMARTDHDVSDFHVYCTVSTPISGEFGGRNILDCLLDPETGIVAQTKARIVRDNYDIFILPDEVRSRGVELRYGKNLLSAYMDTDVSDTITRIKPVGKTKDGEKLYIEENNGWVESPYIDDYPVVYSKEVEYDVVESDELPIDQARALLKEKAEADFVAGCDMATVKLDAEFVRLELTEEYKHLANQYALHLYDSVPVIDREADIVATARMTEYVYDAILDEYQDTALGELEEVKSTIYGYELAAGTVSGGKLIPNTVNGDRLQNSSVSYGKFDIAAIKQLSADSIVAIRAEIRELVAGNITTDQLYADLAEIATAQITAANIDKANIQWAEIENLSAEIAKVVKAEVGNLEVDWAGIYEADIEWANIENLTAEIATIAAATIEKAKINWAQIIDVKIGTADIEDATITTAKIALGAITSALIEAGAIGTAQIADGSITEAKIVSLNADVITSGTLSTERLLIKGAGGLFYEINATAGGLTSTQLTEEQYKNAISGTALVAKSVTADQIAARTITANEILSGTITAAEINVSSLFASDAVIAELDNYVLRTQTIEAIEGQLDVWANEKIRLAVDDVQVGGRNFLKNTGVLKKANWVFDNSSTSAYNIAMGTVTENADAGGLDVVCSEGNVRWWLGHMPVTAGQKYTVSVRYKLNSGESPINFQYIYRDADYKEITNPFYGSSKTQKTKVEDGWTVLYDTLTVPDDASVAYLRLALRAGADNTAYTVSYTYCKPKFEAGTRATDWTPAPEDGELAVKTLEAELSVQAGEISANATKIETVNQAAANAQSTADANAASLTAVTKRVTTAEANISALDGEIKTKVSQADFNALGSRVSSAESTITQQAGQISANATAVQTAQTAANAAQSTANTAQTAANAAQSTANAAQTQANTNKTNLSGVTTRMTTAEANISALDGKISTKVEKTEFDALGNIVSQQGTRIDQTDEQVLILAGQKIGGTNLVRIGTDEQISISVGSISRGSTTYYQQGGVLFSMSAHSGTHNVLTFKEGIKLHSGNYMLSFWCWTYGIDVQPTVQCNLLNMDATRDHYFKAIQPTANTPVKYEIPVNVTYTDTMRLRFVVPTQWTAGTLYFSDVKLEEGDRATAWSPCPDDPAGSVNAGGVVRVDQTGVHLSGGVVEMETSDGDEFIHITNSGITASSLEAPNVAKKYAGPAAVTVNPDATSAQIAGGGYFRSLPEAFAAISNRYLEKSVTITVQGDSYGDASLLGVYGSGSVTVHGGGCSLIGTMTLRDCGSRIYLYNLTVSQPSASTATRAVWIAGCQYVAMESSVTISGNGGTYAMVIEYGSTVWLYGVSLYNATYLMYCIYGTHITTLNLRGGGCTYFAWANGCILKMAGTRPDGSLRTSNAALLVPTDPTTLTIDYGTAQPSVPVVQTATYSYLYSDSYAGKWDYYGNEDIYQGVVRTSDAGDISTAYGVIWFDQAAIKSALNGKTINQANLRLHMRTDAGRGSAVSVQLYGTNTAYTGRSGTPALTASYGDIGSTNPGETAEITIPAQAISDLVSGTICALVLKSSDTELYKDKSYSRNYARFSGTGSATAENCPRLTVVYQ